MTEGYLAVDIGGTKTLVACFDVAGQIVKQEKFATPQNYQEFLDAFKQTLASFGAIKFKCGAIAVPGLLDRTAGVVKGLGNLPWRDKPIKKDISEISGVPVVIENDAKTAGLSEAAEVQNEYQKVLYLTVSTGLGVSVITNGKIDPGFLNTEGGHMLLEHDGKTQKWESYASGRAIRERFGQNATDITDPAALQAIGHDLAIGIYNLIAITQPEVVIIGGGAGGGFPKFGEFLERVLKQYEDSVVPIPPIQGALRPDEAVIYGCYELARSIDADTATTA